MSVASETPADENGRTIVSTGAAVARVFEININFRHPVIGVVRHQRPMLLNLFEADDEVLVVNH